MPALNIRQIHRKWWGINCAESITSRRAGALGSPAGCQFGCASIYVRREGTRLRELTIRFTGGQLEIPVAASYRFADAAQALAQVAGGHAAEAVVLTPGPSP